MQGSGADLVKHAMVRLHAILESPEWGPGTANLVLMIHDELVYEVRANRAHQVAALLKNVMETAWMLKVPTPMEIKIGPIWGQLQYMHID